MSRQISEAVRIELRGESILNSRSEFNRCRVPRLRIDQEGWKEDKLKNQSSHPEETHQTEIEEENSLCKEKHNNKRKSQEDKPKRKPKRIKLDIIEGWGEGTENKDDQNETENVPKGWGTPSDSTKAVRAEEVTTRLQQTLLPTAWAQGVTGDKEVSSIDKYEVEKTKEAELKPVRVIEPNKTTKIKKHPTKVFKFK